MREGASLADVLVWMYSAEQLDLRVDTATCTHANLLTGAADLLP